jgi:UDP-glucose 4-epimerase
MSLILVTGGLGFIGSHTVVTLLDHDFDVVILDDLSNSSKAVLTAIETITALKPVFYQGSILNESLLDEIFHQHQIDGVIHFAAFKAVNESVKLPLKYMTNNISGSIALLQAMSRHHVNKLVFSSSATVYDGSQTPPFVESMRLGSTHAYGKSKVIVEQLLQVLPIDSIALRYFNPVGAHPSGLIGESPLDTPNNLMPLINQIATGTRSHLDVFGNDYPTQDGTPERDYVHVMDVATAHVFALKKLKDWRGHVAVNIGTGKPVSVLTMLQTYQRVNKVPIPYTLVARREGDVASSYANVDLAKSLLGFEASYNLEDMCLTAYRFIKNSQL